MLTLVEGRKVVCVCVTHALQVTPQEVTLAAKCRRTFANAHTYHINSVSTSTDGQTFLSSDDLRVNLWHLERNDQAYNVVDIKPANMEDLNEVCCMLSTSAACSILP